MRDKYKDDAVQRLIASPAPGYRASCALDHAVGTLGKRSGKFSENLKHAHFSVDFCKQKVYFRSKYFAYDIFICSMLTNIDQRS